MVLSSSVWRNTLDRKGYVPKEDSEEIGRTELPFARPLPKGSPLEFRFALAADGLLSVHASDLTTGGEVDLEMQTTALLSADEVEKKRRQNAAIAVS